MKGYVVRKGNQCYAVIYEGLDPITGREHRRRHPAGPDREQADALAHRLADDRLRDRSPRRSSLTVGVYMTQRWLPANQARLRPSTRAGYDRNIRLHIVPRIGRVPLRPLRPDHIERLVRSARPPRHSQGCSSFYRIPPGRSPGRRESDASQPWVGVVL